MNKPTILYLLGHYVTSIDDLRQAFEASNKEEFRSTILTAFKDGILTSWLLEGDKESVRLAGKMAKLDWECLGDRKSYEAIEKYILSHKSSSMISPQIIFNRYAELQECFWSNNKNKENCLLREDDIIYITEKDVVITLNMAFEIINPMNDSINIDLIASKDGKKKILKSTPLNLNVKQNSKQVVEFKFDASKYEKSYVNISVEVDKLPIFKFNVNTTGNYKLKFGDHSLTMIFVKGNSKIKNFYIANTVTVEGGANNPNQPIVGYSYSAVKRLLNQWSKDYGLNFRLPKLKEWLYAAKGGISKDKFKYSGSDKIDEVAWYCENSRDTKKRRSSCSLHDVMEKSPNSLGLYDMSGNVWEMTSDDSERRGHKVICGGSYDSPETMLRLDSCLSHMGGFIESRQNVGFRFVCNENEIEKLKKMHPEYFILEQRKSTKKKEK